MRLLRLTLAVPLALTAVGCINLQTIVKVKPDGSGTLHQTLTMNPQAMEAMMEGMARSMGGEVKKGDKPAAKMEKKTVPGTSAAEAKAKAAEFGEGVTFTSVDPIEKPDAMGATLNFAFKDVNKLHINPKPDKPGKGMGMGAPAAAEEKPEDRVKFRFAKAASGNPQLTVVMGEMKREPKKDATPTPPTGPEELAMMKQMFKGMRILMAVDVDGKVVKTNSPYVEGNRITIIDFDFEKLMENPNLKSLDPIFEGSLDDARTALKGVKGVKMNLEPEVQIEFK
jgi:hypothetical protein